MKRDILLYIEDILQAINDLESFVANVEFANFINDIKTVYAVTRALEIIGEATKNIPESVRQDYPQVPWRQMAGMRDKLSHEYFGVNLKVLWDTAKHSVPNIKPAVEIVRKDLTTAKSDA